MSGLSGAVENAGPISRLHASNRSILLTSRCLPGAKRSGGSRRCVGCGGCMPMLSSAGW